MARGKKCWLIDGIDIQIESGREKYVGEDELVAVPVGGARPGAGEHVGRGPGRHAERHQQHRRHREHG